MFESILGRIRAKLKEVTGGCEGDEDHLDDKIEVGGWNIEHSGGRGLRLDWSGGRLSQSLAFFFFRFVFLINFILKDNIGTQSPVV